MAVPGMWERLVGQDAAVRLLRDALALAASVNCPDGGCGSCDVCAKVLRRAHPDVTTIEAAGAQILVEQVRVIRQAAHRSPFEGKVKVFVLEDAHRLNPAAANALLKVLEEPPAGVLFVLITASPEDLLPTVVSRCRRVDFHPLGPAEIERVLVEHHGADPADAAWAARVAGDLSRALRFVKDADAPSRRAAHVEVPGRLVRGGPGEAVTIAAEIAVEAEAAADALAVHHKDEMAAALEAFGEARSASAAKKRIEDRQKREMRRRETEAFDSALRDVASFYRDVLITAAGAPAELLTNAEMTDRLERAAGAVDPAWLVWALDRIEGTRRALGRNAQPVLALEALFMELGTPRARASVS